MIEIRNGIAYENEKPIILRVSELKTGNDYDLIATFSDGTVKIYDCSKLFRYPTFASLKDRAKFEKVTLDHGVPTWESENLDISPETIYANGVNA